MKKMFKTYARKTDIKGEIKLIERYPMKIVENSEGIRYVDFDLIEKTNIAKAGFSLGNRWKYIQIAHGLGIEPDMMVHPKETHTCNVKRVTHLEGGSGIIRPFTLYDIDAVVTDEPGVAICMIASDCAVIYLVDTGKRCIGIVHSGRRGTQGNIAAVTVEKMQEYFGTAPEDIVAAISPCICGDCYEVDELTAKNFISCLKKEWHGDIMKEKNGRYYLDIAKTIFLQLMEIGVSRIQMPEYCTFQNRNFASYRREKYGSNAAWLVLND